MIRKTKTYKLFRKALLVIPIILFFVPGIFSQEVTQIEDVTVISTYEPSVADVLKINISPKIP
ncbi:MAG: hypothetical protein K8R68_01480, partial [Bacteroidales bacterium]|nr:hypothetical protein [Bacteroidales bacterium]